MKYHGQKISGSDGMVFDAAGRLFFGIFDYVSDNVLVAPCCVVRPTRPPCDRVAP